jgi:pentafunctional AROM polypeptide
MHERPVGDLVDALRIGLSALLVDGAPSPSIEYMGKEGCLPLRITLAPSLSFDNGGADNIVRLAVNSTESSQFQSALLLATPSLLHRGPKGMGVVVEGGSEVLDRSGIPTIVSGGYIHMSAHMLKQFGVTVRAVTDEERCGSSVRLAYEVRLPIPPTNPTSPTSFSYTIEPDMSASSNFHALAGGRCLLDGSDVVPTKYVHLQSDNDFPSSVVAPIVHTIRWGGDLTIDMDTYTDSFIAASALTVFGGLWCTYCQPHLHKDWIVKLVNIANQRVKECDRLAATVKEMGKVCAMAGGRVSISELSDGIQIVFCTSSTLVPPTNPAPSPTCYMDTYDDHRVAMASAVLGVLFSCLPNAPALPIVIKDFRCVEKTFPSFFNFI